MIKLDISEKPDKNWNVRLKNSPVGTIYHTKEHGDVMKFLGRTPFFLKFLDNTENIIAQMLVSTYPVHDKSVIGNFFQKIPIIKNKYCNWNFGPVIFDSNYNKEVSESFADFLFKNRYLPIGSEAPLLGGSLSTMNQFFISEKWATFLIDLSEEKEVLWGKLKERRNITRAQKAGVHVKQISYSDLEYYRQVREETKPVPLSTLQKRWNLLSEVGWTGFLAFIDDKPIGGILLSFFNGYINEWGVARTKKDTVEKLYAQDLLKWKIIEWGKKNNFRYYDLTGVKPDLRDKKEEGIFHYKKKWGGKYIEFNKIISKGSLKRFF